MLTPEMTEGRYWIDDALTRRDVTEDIRGVPLVLRLSVVDAGHQRSDAAGRVLRLVSPAGTAAARRTSTSSAR